MIEALLWGLKVLGAAIVLGFALGIIILLVGIAREAVWTMRQQNRRENKQEEET